MHESKPQRKGYSPPVLHKWGNVADLTHLGGSGGAGDNFVGGSVNHSQGNPPPHAGPR